MGGWGGRRKEREKSGGNNRIGKVRKEGEGRNERGRGRE